MDNLAKGFAGALIVLLVTFAAITFRMTEQLDEIKASNTDLRNANSLLTNENTGLEEQVATLEERNEYLEGYTESIMAFYEEPYYTAGWIWRTENHVDYTINVFMTNFGSETGTANLVLTFKDENNVTRNLDYKSVTIPGRSTVLSTWQYTFPDRNVDNILVTIDQ